MNEDTIDAMYDLVNQIQVTEENEEMIAAIKEDLENEEYYEALEKLKTLTNLDEEEEYEEESEEVEDGVYPEELCDSELEHLYIGMLLNNPKLITKFYFTYKECYFEDGMALNNYKSVLFTEASKYTPEIAKQGFNFARETQESRDFKAQWKNDAARKKRNMEEIYVELKKLFVLRKAYIEMPIKEARDNIVEITSYLLYKQMSIQEVESAIRQVNDTGKFKRAVISEGLTNFLEKGENNLTNGLPLPFPILSSVFKGIRKGETTSFSMPSNSGKSRFTINLAAYT